MKLNNHDTVLPERWAKSSLGEIATYVNGRAFKPKEWQKTGKPIIRIQNLNKPDAAYNYSPETYEDRYLVNHGDLLYAWSASLGAYIWNGPDAWLNQHIFRVIPKPGVDKLFLYYLLTKVTSELYAKAHGSGMVHVTKGKFEETTVSLPPLNEQQRIVAKIETLFSELDKGIESLKTAREQLKVYRQAVLKHAFEGKLTAQWREENKGKLESPEQLLSRIQQERQARYQQQLKDWKAAIKTWEDNGKDGKKPGKPREPFALKKCKNFDFEVPDAWAVLQLEALAYESVLGKMLDKEKNSGTERPYLGNINVRWGEFNLENLKSMKIEGAEAERYSLKVGDLVICEGGEPGRCAIWKDKEKTVFIQKALHRVRFTESYDPKFAFYYMIYSTPLERVIKHFTGTTIKHLTGAGLSKIQFPICTASEQKEVLRVLDSSLSEVGHMEKEIDDQIKKSEALRQSILKKAFSGQLYIKMRT